MPDNTKAINTNQFVLESVQETTPPAGIQQGKWYSYIIGRGKSVISGKRAGTLRSVTQHAESIVEDINSRSMRHGSLYVSQRVKQKS